MNREVEEALAMLQLPDPRVAMSLDELQKVQSVAMSHIAFSLTLACPLRCGHCIVEASEEKSGSTVPVATARIYASQMKSLREYGIRTVSFTGGEPTVAPRQLSLLSEAAGNEGMRCGIVTSAYWAKTRRDSARMIESFPSISDWDLSIDRYHQEFVPMEYVRNAYAAAVSRGRQVTLRFTFEDPPAEREREILEFISTMGDANFSSQKVRPLGRGAGAPVTKDDSFNPWMKPCLTQGIVVRYDGSIAPCCLNLIESRKHPFEFGNAENRPLEAIHRDFRVSPLLQLMRLIGLGELYRWIHAGGLAGNLPETLPDDACDICALMMNDRAIGEFLSEKAGRPEIRLRTAVMLSKVFGEEMMLQDAIGRCQGMDLASQELEKARELCLQQA